MPRLSSTLVSDCFNRVASGATTTQKGAALEDLICHLFGIVPGVSVAIRNVLSPFGTEEVDVVFWNKMLPDGLFFLHHLILVECKNWSARVDGETVAYFATRLRHLGCTDGILVAANGITGDPATFTGAHHQIMLALVDDRKILVLTRSELEALRSIRQLVDLLQQKRLQLIVNRTQLL
jgi:hypothetical protein